MRAFVDHHEKCVVGERADEVGGQEHDPPGLVPEKPGDQDLDGDEAQDDPESRRILSDQSPHFRVGLENKLGADAVRLGAGRLPESWRAVHGMSRFFLSRASWFKTGRIKYPVPSLKSVMESAG